MPFICSAACSAGMFLAVRARGFTHRHTTRVTEAAGDMRDVVGAQRAQGQEDGQG
jgi:hypothetical protein